MGVSTRTKRWTLEELDSLPDDDGNVYELIHGTLFVSPASGPPHEEVVAPLNAMLTSYVTAQGLGLLYFHSVVQLPDSHVEPDIAVRQSLRGVKNWQEAPRPILVVEVVSPSTRRLDRVRKREFYLEEQIPEYWIIDAELHSATRVRPGVPDEVATERLIWTPDGATEPLVIELEQLVADI